MANPSAIAARKKSIVSAGGMLQIDTPVAASTILNKAASQSTSLYQQCSQLRDRLLRIHDFPPYLARTSSSARTRQSDPVNQLWDCLALGVPLCFLFNLLPPPAVRIDINTDPDDIDDSVKSRQRATFMFVTNIMKLQRAGAWEGDEVFVIGDLVNTECNPTGFGKVVRTVTALVDRLPPHVFMEEPLPPSPSAGLDSPTSLAARSRTDSDAAEAPPPVPASARENDRRNIIREMLETERKYVGDLEIMQQFATQLLQRGVMDADTLHHMFPNLPALLDFQQRFLIRMEQVAEHAWPEQHWGRLFSETEDDFQVYEPYCAHYSSAADIVLNEETTLSNFVAVISTSELPAFLIKPVQRICKYPLLLDSLLKAARDSDYPYMDELREGVATAKRIADKINEAQRRAENRHTVKTLESRVEDWKGHHLKNFGELLLDDVFIVTKSDVDREYHVFLFEKIILCCKEAVPTAPRKVGKSPSLLKKQAAAAIPATLTSAGAAARKRTTPLLLKGRIFLNNVTVAQPANKSGQWSLQVWWKGDDDLEYFTLRCRTEEQLRLWEATITRLIKELFMKKNADRAAYASIPRFANSTNPALPPSLPFSPAHERMTSYTQSMQSNTSTLINYPHAGPSMAARSRMVSYHPDEGVMVHAHSAYSSSSRNGSRDGFDDDDGESDYQYSQYSSVSGRGTPMGERRAAVGKSMPPERDLQHLGYERARARTEDVGGALMREWKSRPPQAAPPTGALPPTPSATRPGGLPRNMSTASQASSATAVSDVSFGNSVGGRPTQQLRSQFSSARLRGQEGPEPTVSRFVGHGGGSANSSASSLAPHPPPMTRSRSASQPSHPSFVQQPPQQAPPLPNGHSGHGAAHWARGAPDEDDKRGSGSSQSTGAGSSDYSPPHTMSPVTPYGSNDSGGSLRAPRGPYPFHPLGASTLAHNPVFALQQPVKIKVHYGDDLFMIVVPRATMFDDLLDKVGKKIRLCGPRREDQPLRVKYQDEDGDMISLASNEDVQLAFESAQVTLFVA